MMGSRAPSGYFRNSLKPPSRSSQQCISSLGLSRYRHTFALRESVYRSAAPARKQGRCCRHRVCALTGRSLEPSRRRGHREVYVRCSGGSTVQNAPTGGKDFFAWLLDLPWKRVGIWALVGMLAYQLSEFFGVSPFLLSHLLVCACRSSVEGI
jgi:hypothetical protein